MAWRSHAIWPRRWCSLAAPTSVCGALPCRARRLQAKGMAMARIEWVAQRLENWALWNERSRSGGLGFARQSAFLRVAVDGERCEAVIPVDEIEAVITDEAVSALKPERAHLHETVVLYYIEGLSVLGIAQRLHRAQSTVHGNLAQADAVLSVWFADRRRKKEAEARELQKKLQAARSPRLDAFVLSAPK